MQRPAELVNAFQFDCDKQRMRIVFIGTGEIGVPTLRALQKSEHEVVGIVTQPDKPVGRHHELRASPVKEFAQIHGLRLHQLAKIKNEEAKALFASHNADAAIVVAYGKILPAEFLNAPKHGCINLHFSLLPKYRGAAPVNWAIVSRSWAIMPQPTQRSMPSSP